MGAGYRSSELLKLREAPTLAGTYKNTGQGCSWLEPLAVLIHMHLSRREAKPPRCTFSMLASSYCLPARLTSSLGNAEWRPDG